MAIANNAGAPAERNAFRGAASRAQATLTKREAELVKARSGGVGAS